MPWAATTCSLDASARKTQTLHSFGRQTGRVDHSRALGTLLASKSTEMSMNQGWVIMVAILLSLCVPAVTSVFAQGYQESPEAVRVLNQGIALTASGRPQDACKLLQGAVRRFPQSPYIHFHLGNALCDSHSYDDAITEYETALRLRSPFPDAELNIAYCLCNLGRQGESLSWFQRYLQESPNAANRPKVQSQMLIAQASKLSEDKRFFDAKNALRQAVSLTPDLSTAHFKLARVCDELGDTQGAINEYEEVVRLEPKNSAAVFNIAGCFQTMGQPMEAINWFQRYLDNNPQAPDRQTVLNMMEKLKEAGSRPVSNPQAADYLDAIRDQGKLYRWPQESLPLKVFISAGQGVTGYTDSYGRILVESLSAWSLASQNRVAFLIVQNPQQADIDCQWTGNPYEVMKTGSDVEQGVCLTKGRTKSNIDYGFIEHVTVRILTVDRETLKPIKDDDMKKTCLHELGHALGLRGHSPNNHDIMFFSVSPTVWPVLSKRDKSTLCRLYTGYRELAGQQ